jgi:dTDP-glucose pyrophosphorylase
MKIFKNYELTLINQNATILEALNQINSFPDNFLSRFMLFVKSDNESIIGSLTDGDIRRALTKNKDLHIKVSKICNKNFTYEFYTDNYLNLSVFKNKGINILPILDKKKRFKNLIDLDKINAMLPLECVIMAGGFGKRLASLTEKIPKPMLMLGNKPIIEHNIDNLISYGIKKIIISLGYLGHQIEDYFGDGSSKGIEINYIYETKPLGTAGSLTLIEKFDNDNILLINSDIFTNINFEEMFLSLISSKADMIIASSDYKIDVPLAIFEEKDNIITDFKEKPSYTYYSNAGIYMFNKKIIKKIPKNQFFDITDLMNIILVEKGKLIHSPIRGYWIDIGTPTDYLRAQEIVNYIN